MAGLCRFFCCDSGNKLMVELGGWDKAGNFNHCWSGQLIEDKEPSLPTSFHGL
ncbi:MAG: hypothetical protein IPH94_19530 [Saprospiraceae bacterium]|nr:hypothetical protein [Saprospiraceae bacterium]